MIIRHHHARPPAPGSARRRSSSGAALVELGLSAVLLATLAAGAFDFGMAWRTGIATTEGARTGARVGSAQGDIVGADYALLTSMKAALSSSGLLNNVDRVVIYRSNTSDGAVPSNCKTTTSSSVSDKCDILTGAQFRALTTSSTYDSAGCMTGSQTKSWCPTTRNNIQLSADYLGVWVQVTHNYKFKLIGTTKTIQRSAVMRLEPTEG